MNILKKLKQHTFAVQHSPNCSSPYLVRLVGRGAGVLDFENKGSKDAIGYGQTLEEAGVNALEARLTQAWAALFSGVCRGVQ